ncbi:MAG TPA: TCP-1/cpn60 chaperonin family protein [Bacillota bacterium]|nr:TCP-1/cpn60 chaperonin family protein [Bacillota bacterium]
MANTTQGREGEEKLSALMNNAAAIRAIAAAVEGTIGPKGLDTMLVDRYGDVLITNAGVTILEKMDVTHPAARLLINVAKAQQEEIGDGTTTATIIASALITQGAEQVLKGVPIARVIDGVRFGVKQAIASIEKHSRPLETMDRQILKNVALVAGRDHEDIADLAVEAACLVGAEKLKDPAFKLADMILAKEGANNEVFLGVVIEKEPVSKEMPHRIEKAKIMLFDDALEPEELGEEALATESGFARYMELQSEFRSALQKIVELGVNVILTDKGIHVLAEETFTDAGIMVLTRVPAKVVRRVAEHTGARRIKRSGLKKNLIELESYIGYAEQVCLDEKLDQVRVLGGKHKAIATILVGASTAEVVGERERIAKDAASSVQAAVRGGVVPGGGAIEITAAREIMKLRDGLKGMSAYGLDCVVEALKRPLAQIVENAGFNPLEKVEEVMAAQSNQNNDCLTLDCDSGEVTDLYQQGIMDPTLVKLYALKAAGEVAEAILRIDTIIKKRDHAPTEMQAQNQGLRS